MTATRHLIGLMSGTSLDGVDGVLARFEGQRIDVLAHSHRPFDARLRKDLLGLQAPADGELERAALAAQGLAKTYHACVEGLLTQAGMAAQAIAAIAVHGQTVRHRPELGYTAQLNNPALLAELCGIDVICDFRSRDVAAGGHGAPLVPAFHAAVFGAKDECRVALNLGGMANVTVLPAREDQAAVVTGWDTGPGNVLLDAWFEKCHPDAAEHFDRNGQFAAHGQIRTELLARLLADPWLALPPPKSTGRDAFHLEWLVARLQGESPADVQCTLTEFTARTIAEAIATHAGIPARVIVCGGGAANGYLLARISENLQLACHARVPLESCTSYGFAPDEVEATAFAWLGEQFLNREPGNLPAVTGARGPRILGALYPA